MRLPRFFITPDSVRGEHITLHDSIAHQIQRVLRLRAGERIVVLDNSGAEFEVELLSVRSDEVTGRLIARTTSRTEPRVRITLYQALLKLDKFEWVLQKATEIGIAAFTPIVTERVARDDVSAKKMERWQRIVREAAEQSERGMIPPLREPINFAEAIRAIALDALSLIPYEEEHTTSLRTVLRKDLTGFQNPSGLRIHLFIGPEGGFSAAEIELAKRHHVIPVTLGPRILRAETAGLVAASAILYELGDL